MQEESNGSKTEYGYYEYYDYYNYDYNNNYKYNYYYYFYYYYYYSLLVSLRERITTYCMIFHLCNGCNQILHSEKPQGTQQTPHRAVNIYTSFI